MKKGDNTSRYKAIFALILLAPVLGEILSGSSPPSTFFRPVYFLFLLGMYGCGVLLFRDLVRARNLGWINIAILGLAYGIIEEGLIITSFYNLEWGGVKPLGTYGYFFGISWIWAIFSSFTHVSLTVFSSIVLAESLFPQLADKAWLTAKQRGLCGLSFFVSSIFGYHLFTNVLYPGYSPPFLPYLLIVVLTIIAIIVGLTFRSQVDFEKISSNFHHFRYFTVGLVASLASIIASYTLVKIGTPSLVTILLMSGVIFFVGYFILSWLKRFGGWAAADRLALASGVMAPWLIRMPLLELRIMAGVREMDMTGMSIAATIVVILLWKGFKTLQIER